MKYPYLNFLYQFIASSDWQRWLEWVGVGWHTGRGGGGGKILEIAIRVDHKCIYPLTPSLILPHPNSGYFMKSAGWGGGGIFQVPRAANAINPPLIGA